jgi:hypothetical protein
MISVARKSRPRRGPNRVQLVNLDGSPHRRPKRDHALTWPASTDNWRWEPIDRVIGTDSRGADVHQSDCVPEDGEDGEAGWIQTMIEASLPTVAIPGIDPEPETDAEFFARLAADEAAEKARVLATYHPLPEDLAEYAAWSEGLDAGTLPAHVAQSFRFGCMAEVEHYRPGQPTDDELAQLAAHGAI